MSEFQRIRIDKSREGAVWTITLCRPEVKNALDLTTFKEIAAAFGLQISGDQRPGGQRAGARGEVLGVGMGVGRCVDCQHLLHARDARGECKGARDVAAKFGMIFVSPDYRAKTSWMGSLAEADTVQLIGELRQRHKVGRVFLVGGSMGGTAVLTFAALHPELVAGVCSLNGTANHVEYDKFQDAIAASFGGTKAQVPEEYKKRSAELWPEKVTMPVAFTTGGKDKIAIDGYLPVPAGFVFAGKQVAVNTRTA